MSYVVWVRRWQRLLVPVAQVGFATTAVLPGRLGEVLRPYLLARGEWLSASAVHVASSGRMANVSDTEPVGVSEPEACGPMPGRPLVRKGGGHGRARHRLRLSRSGWLRER